MVNILSIENELRWSWSNSIHQLIERLPSYKFVRIRRGLYNCENPSCQATQMHPVDEDLQEYFDLLLTQNHDGARYLKRRDKTVLRIGGLHMKPNMNPDRYAEDFKGVGAIIATNDQLAGFALRTNPNTTVIPNGVDLDHFKPREGWPDKQQQPFVIGFAGNIDGQGGPYKGWKFFVGAQVKLAMEGVAAKSVLYRHSQIPHDEMPAEFYHKIDALILPSQGEGCSNVVTEALACGVPVISTKTGFHGERLTDGENVLYIERDLETSSPQTTDQICDAVRRLMQEPELYRRLAMKGREFAVEHHDVRQVAAQYDTVFQALLAPERKADYERTGTEQTN